MSYERRKVKTGRVVSDKMDRTIVVQVEWRSPHRLYKKPIRRMSKFMVHDPDNASMVGDIVQVIESRPRSKTKRWRLVKILQRSEVVDIRPEEIGEDSQPAVAVSELPAEPVSTTDDAVEAVEPEVEVVAEADAELDDAGEAAEPVAEAEPAPDDDDGTGAEDQTEAEAPSDGTDEKTETQPR